MKYTNCPTCGSLCIYVPQPPKEAIRIDVVTDHEKDRMFYDAVRIEEANNKTLEEFLDSVPFDSLWQYIRQRILWPKGRPIKFSDIMGF